MYRLRSRVRRLFLVAASAAVSFGCGPYSTPSMLDSGSPLLVMPPVPLALELNRIPPLKPPPFKLVTPPQTRKDEEYRGASAVVIDSAASTRDADLADLKEALAALHAPEEARKALLERYASVRGALQKYTTDSTVWAALYDFEREREKLVKPDLPSLTVPAGLPAEFDLYLTGAIAWHEKKPDAALAAWKKLLDLPEKERHYRSVWAAYMIGKALIQTTPADAIPWFEKTRALAQARFADRLGLAVESLGWQAKAEYDSKHFQEALEHYMRQRAAGADVTGSVSFVCRAILQASQNEILSAAQNPLSRRAVTASLVADVPTWRHPGWGAKWPGAAWLEALDKADVDALEDADRLAWIAYEGGDIASAQRWLKRAPAASAAAAWLRAKLLLRDNKPKEAAPLLARVVKLLPKDPTLGAMGKQGEWVWDYWLQRMGWDYPSGPVPASQVMGDIGAVHLARREFTEALRALLEAGFIADAAYLAERVLTPEELVRCLDLHYAKPAQAELDSRDSAVTNSAHHAAYIRDVLARRLIRAGRLEQARKYVSEDVAPILDAYAAALAAGRDAKRPKAERAEALWNAARIAHDHERRLLENDTERDWYYDFGVVDMKQTRDAHRADVEIALLKPTDTEQERLKATAAIHEKSSQTPYIAANIAWEAIQLMPDNSDETARALIEAGSWLKARDPKAADRFYKALVRRCGKTPLGVEADHLRWFSQLEPAKPATESPAEHH